jgi:hypothetical protein
MSEKNGINYKEVIATEDCEVYCNICNKTLDLKKGEPIPLCCGKIMQIM